MAIRNIVKIGDPILSKTSRKVEKFDERLWQLLDDIFYLDKQRYSSAC